jgi:hypothetical protein
MAFSRAFDYVYQVELSGGKYVIKSGSSAPVVAATAVTVTEDSVGSDPTNLLSTTTNDTFRYTSSGATQSQTFTYKGGASGQGSTALPEGSFIAQGADNKFYLFTNQNFTAGNGTVSANLTPDVNTVICFLPGTQIATSEGEVSVETLQRGDLVKTVDGRQVPVRWIGRQTISTIFADPLRVLPICIKAGALAENVPSRDLYVSPDHAILIDEILVHASALVNGISIVRAPAPAQTFTYYHVELADHSLLLADNVPAESFIDNVDRLAFDNWDEHEALGDEAAPLVEMTYPRAKAARQVPVAMRERLAARGQALFGTVTTKAA